MLRRVLAASTLAAALMSASACGLSTPDNNKKENLSGTIPVGGQSDFNFTVSNRGEVQATVTALTPTPSSQQLFMGLGSVDNGRCIPFVNLIASVVVGRPPTSPWFVEKGSYCFSISDPTFTLTATTSYTATLSHP